MTPRRVFHAKPSLTRKNAAAQLTRLLYFCTPERLRSFTAAGLVRAYNVPLATAEKMLADARRGRLSCR